MQRMFIPRPGMWIERPTSVANRRIVHEVKSVFFDDESISIFMENQLILLRAVDGNIVSILESERVDLSQPTPPIRKLPDIVIGWGPDILHTYEVAMT